MVHPNALIYGWLQFWFYGISMVHYGTLWYPIFGTLWYIMVPCILVGYHNVPIFVPFCTNLCTKAYQNLNVYQRKFVVHGTYRSYPSHQGRYIDQYHCVPPKISSTSPTHWIVILITISLGFILSHNLQVYP